MSKEKTIPFLEFFASIWDLYPRWFQGLMVMIMTFNGIHWLIEDIIKLINYITNN